MTVCFSEKIHTVAVNVKETWKNRYTLLEISRSPLAVLSLANKKLKMDPKGS